MKSAHTDQQSLQKTNMPLRLWPGVVIVVLQWLARFVLPILAPEAGTYGVFAGPLGWLALVVWWVFFSRTKLSERWGAAILMIVALIATPRILHESIAKGGMGFLFYFYATPVLSLAFVAWAVASPRLSGKLRQTAMFAAIVLGCGVWTLFRTAGTTGGGDWDFEWRWTGTPEDRLLAQAADEPLAKPSSSNAPLSPRSQVAPVSPVTPKTLVISVNPVAPESPMISINPVTPATFEVLAPRETEAEWPGFRGPARDSVVRGVRLDTDWVTSPPVELWRRPIGPGWSSFAVSGDLLYTQEQRGDEEVAASYDLTSGQPVWQHRDTARFWESQAGAGPRATPTLSGGSLYTFGATGILNALDASDGTVLWSRNAATDTDKKIPGWGFSSSPLVVDDLVIVHAGKLIAYDVDSGEPRWFGPAGGSYSSPHLVTIEGVRQVLMQSGVSAASVSPSDGSLLWEHPWTGGIVQPALTSGGDVLIAAGGMSGGLGIRRVSVARSAGGWTTDELWTSARLKANFNDFVVHQGSAFGFDGSILACIDLEDGERRWKGGRYGNGQLLLLPDQDLLLVLSEKGELALVEASPDNFTELARFPAIKGKTWNHPALVNDLLLVRNGEEMAAFRLSLAD